MKSKFKTINEFEEWRENEHEDCQMNFIGSSSEMERVSTKEIFVQSFDYYLIHKWMVSDTNTYLDI